MYRNKIGTETLRKSWSTRHETSCADSAFVIALENYSRVIPTRKQGKNYLVFYNK